MRAALWWVIGLSVISLLIVGAVGLFTLLLAFNGVSEARGASFVIAYLILLVATLGFTFWFSRRLFRRFTQRPDRSLWISIPLTILLAVLSGTALLLIGLFALVFAGTT